MKRFIKIHVNLTAGFVQSSSFKKLWFVFTGIFNRFFVYLVCEWEWGRFGFVSFLDYFKQFTFWESIQYFPLFLSFWPLLVLNIWFSATEKTAIFPIKPKLENVIQKPTNKSPSHQFEPATLFTTYPTLKFVYSKLNEKSN